MKADLLLHGGHVWCGPGRQLAQAVAIRSGEILAVGRDDEVLALAHSRASRVNLRGRLVTPGLIDSHIHMLAFGVGMGELDFRETTRLADILAAIRTRAAEAGPGRWIKTRAHDDQRLDVRRHPTRQELDAVAPDNPLVMIRTCGHVFVCNSRALALGGIDERTPVPPGGVIERAGGRLTGLVAETARELIKAAQPRRSRDDLKEGFLRGARYLCALGITGVMEAGVGRMTGSIEEFRALEDLAADRSLPVRVNMAITAGEHGIIDEVLESGRRFGEGNDLAWIGPAKLHTDGSAGGRTAAMSVPYHGQDCTCGVLIYDDEEFAQKVIRHHCNGFQVAVHAIGDRAIEQTIGAFERADRIQPVMGRRHRIEHCGFPTPDHIARMVRIGLVPSPQPVFMHDFGDAYLDLLGDERAAAGYPMRSWLAAGLMPAIGTDAPVSRPEPLTNLYAAVTRRTRGGAIVGANERIDIDEALTAYTAAGAFAQHAEHRRGMLGAGMAADLAVFSEDFVRADAAAVLPQAQCDLTILAGRVVHDRHGELGSE